MCDMLTQTKSANICATTGLTMATKKFALSRSAIEQHIKCPRCFYMERKLKLKAFRMVPLTLAVAVDALLKNEFDAVRQSGQTHPLWEREGLKMRAFQHEMMDTWRSNFKGIRVTHPATGIDVFGAVDDIWQNKETGELHIVDYKSTSKQDEPTIEGGFGDSYKRQMEIYQWLLRQSGHKVNNEGYFLYVNGRKKDTFYDETGDGKMGFNTTLIRYTGDDSWVTSAVDAALSCYEGDEVPKRRWNCDSCTYFYDRLKLGLDDKIL